MAIIELSTALHELADQSTLLKARVAMGELRLRFEIARELCSAGLPCGEREIQKIIAGLPENVRYSLIAKLS